MADEFLKIYDQHYDSIYRYTYARIGNKSDVEDIVSEVFRKAFENYRKINSNARAWLFSIARNSINDYYRKGKYRTADLDEVFCTDNASIEDSLDMMAELECLKKSLSSLDNEDYDLISLRYFSNLKYEDISDILGKQSDYLRVKVSRAVKKIGNMLIRCLEG